MAIKRSVALRYAQALARLAQEAGLEARATADLENMQEYFLSNKSQVLSIISNPGFTLTERRALLDALCERAVVCEIVHSFLCLLLDKHRFSHFTAILAAWRELMDQRAGRLRATVTSPHSVDESILTEIQQALTLSTGQPVMIETRQDPRLIAGLVVQIKDTVFDASLSCRLESMRSMLLTSTRSSET